jgi:hypothetical protein
MKRMMLVVSIASIALASSTSTARAEGKKNKWLAAGLNWVLPGAGYMYNGEKPLYVTVPMIAGAVALTYVENFHEFDDGKRLLDHDRTAFGVLFGAVFVLNTALAIDAYREANSINRRLEAGPHTAWRFDVRPVRAADSSTGYTLVIGRSF